MMYAPFPYVSIAQEAADFVRARRNEGATYLKLFYESGQGVGMTLPSLELPTIRALVDAAHAENMLAVAHGHQAVDAVDCGVDVLAHAPTDEMTHAQIAAIVEAKAAVIATLSIQDGFPSPGEPAPLLTQAALVEALSPAWIDVLEAQSKRWMPPQMPSFEIAAQNVGALHRAGCTILAGTDAPNPGTVHGASLHRELQHLVAAGLSPVAALRAATADPAEVFALVGPGGSFLVPSRISCWSMEDLTRSSAIHKRSSECGNAENAKISPATTVPPPNVRGSPFIMSKLNESSRRSSQCIRNLHKSCEGNRSPAQTNPRRALTDAIP